MIFKESIYNPLEPIFSLLSNKLIVTGDIEKIKQELELGGILPESDDEFTLLLNSLIDIYYRDYVKQKTQRQ
jgi:hypothetical protein